MFVKSQPPPLPKGSLRRAWILTYKLQTAYDQLECYEEQVNLPMVERITNVTLATMGTCTTARRDAVYRSIGGLMGRPFTVTSARTLTRRLASSMDLLEQGRHVYCGTIDYIDEDWHILQIIDTHEIFGGLRLDLQIDYGPFADTRFSRTVDQSDILPLMLWRRLRLDKDCVGMWGMMTQMRFWGLVSTRNGQHGFTRHEMDARLESVNREIMKLRRPPCPHGYNHPCVSCPVGYDQCPAGCRMVTIGQVRINGNSAANPGDRSGTA